MFDAVQFCKDYDIPATTEGPNTAAGWLQINCPFCGGGDMNNPHLGFNLAKDYCNCWKCEHHFLDETIMALIGCSKFEAQEIINTYEIGVRVHLQKKEFVPAENVTLPPETIELNKQHIMYLRKRNFDYRRLEKIYRIKGTSHLGEYKFRIIIPIYYEGELVSYQGRDVTGLSELRYKACPKALEKIEHKSTLYALDIAKKVSKTCVVVEGVTDVWRLGPGAIATFGIAWKKAQLQKIATSFTKVFVLYDIGTQAQAQAFLLAQQLQALGVDTELLTGLQGDPGELSDEEAKELMEELGFDDSRWDLSFF